MFLAPVIASMSAGLAGATAAIGGASTLATIGSVASAGAGVMSSLYQAKVANANASIAEQNAARTRQEGAVKAQEGDFSARAEMGQLLANAGASGITAGVGSKLLQRKSAAELATRDRSYTRYGAETEAVNFKQQANDLRAGGKSGVFFSLLSGAGEIGGSMISGAAKVNSQKARTITRGIS